MSAALEFGTDENAEFTSTHAQLRELKLGYFANFLVAHRHDDLLQLFM